MANSLIRKSMKAFKIPNFLTALSDSAYPVCHFSSVSTVEQSQSDAPSSSSSFTFSWNGRNKKNDDSTYMKAPNLNSRRDAASSSSVTMPMSFMTGSIVGKRFYKQVTTREADDRNGWTVMLDHRTLKMPSKRPLKLPTVALAKAIAAECEYQIKFIAQANRYGITAYEVLDCEFDDIWGGLIVMCYQLRRKASAMTIRIEIFQAL